jgi:hypothetical protein
MTRWPRYFHSLNMANIAPLANLANPITEPALVLLGESFDRLTSLPACWDTPRAGTNEGYFDFQQIAFFAHVNSSYKYVSTKD